MNTQQTSTVCDRKNGHPQNSCAKKETMGDNTRTDFQELRHFQEISGKSRKEISARQNKAERVV